MSRHRIADVYKAGVLAARLERHGSGTRFSYLPAYLAGGGEPVATTLPLTDRPVDTASGAVPPFFTGLLPEGRRLASLRRAVKTSADDELGLLMAAGSDPVGDVQIVPHGDPLPGDGAAQGPEHAVELDPRRPPDFAALVDDPALVDPKALAGVQDKVSAGMISLPAAQAGRRYILKLNAPEFRHVVENELLMYRHAARLRIPVSTVRIVHDVAGRAGLLVERFDRPPDPAGASGGATARLAVEDGSQLLGLYPADKYNVGYGELVRAMAERCAAPLPALRNLVLQGAFAWLTGNGDLHAKNLSLVRTTPGPAAAGAGEWRVAPVYDIPSTVPYGDRTLALPIGGKRAGISRRHFLAWSGELGLPARAAEGAVGVALRAAGPLLAALEAHDGGPSPFPPGQTRAWVKELRHRRRLMEG